MYTTIKEVLTIKYNNLLENIKQHTNIEIFPSLDDFEMYELIYYFNTYFMNCNDRKQIVLQIIESKELNISNKELDLIFPYIDEFLTIFHQLMKKQG